MTPFMADEMASLRAHLATRAMVHSDLVVEIPASEVVGSIKIKVTGMKVMRIRWWFAGHLFRFAGWISGCACEVST